MNMRKPRVFLASTFWDLRDERAALIKVFQKHQERIDFAGYEGWPPNGEESFTKSRRKARESDYLVLILGRRRGSRDPATGKSITQLEYEDFLYTHTNQCSNPTPPLFIFERNPGTIQPVTADPPGGDLTELLKFTHQVKTRHFVKSFNDWMELQQLVDTVLQGIPQSVEDKDYRKVSIRQFDFKIMGLGIHREDQIESRLSACPCTVHENGGCDFIIPQVYRPPADLRTEMEGHLKEYFKNPETPTKCRKPQPSFKTIEVKKCGKKLLLTFCYSTWHQFTGTNQAPTREDEYAVAIKTLLKNAPEKGLKLEVSPFSNNLGIAIAVIDSKTERLYSTIRSFEGVSIHAGLKSTAVGTQLHAYDPDHTNADGAPNIFGAAYKELVNEAGLSKSDIRDLYIAAWGIETRTGTPDLILVCDSEKPLSEVREDVFQARVEHHEEFDREKMEKLKNKGILLDYELLADLNEHPVDWEPEAAVASCLALNQLVRDCVSFQDLISNR